MEKKYAFDDLYFAVVFTLLLVSLFEGISVITLRWIALGMTPVLLVGILLKDWAEGFAARSYQKRRSEIEPNADWK